MSESVLKTITVWVPGMAVIEGAYVAPHVLKLPASAVRWEVYQDPGYLKPIQFMAVAQDGTVVEIHGYAHGFWSKWKGEDR